MRAVYSQNLCCFQQTKEHCLFKARVSKPLKGTVLRPQIGDRRLNDPVTVNWQLQLTSHYHTQTLVTHRKGLGGPLCQQGEALLGTSCAIIVLSHCLRKQTGCLLNKRNGARNEISPCL